MRKIKRKLKLPMVWEGNEANLRKVRSRILAAYEKVRLGRIANEKLRDLLFKAGIPKIIVDSVHTLEKKDKEILIDLLSNEWDRQCDFFRENFHGKRLEKLLEELYWKPK
jgi:hypothetical protein